MSQYICEFCKDLKNRHIHGCNECPTNDCENICDACEENYHEEQEEVTIEFE